MKLFTIGPTEMYPTTKNIRQEDIPYFRTDDFSSDMMQLDSLLKKNVGTDNSSNTVYLTASGTAAMEAVIINCFDSNDNLLVICGGTFGSRFKELCLLYKIPHDTIELEHDEQLTQDHLDKYSDHGYTALMVNLHETSTGQLYDINILKDFCARKDMYLMVDAISTFLCDNYKMDNWGIDATIISTQKGLCVTPGMSMIVINKRLSERIRKRPKSCMYFDFKDYFDNIKRGQTPFTPAVGIVYEVLDMLKFIEENGLDNHLKHISDLAETYREHIVDDGIYFPSFKKSNAITTTCFAKPIANEMYRALKDEHGFCVNPSGGEIGKSSFRVSHVGALTNSDMIDLAQLIKALYHNY